MIGRHFHANMKVQTAMCKGNNNSKSRAAKYVKNDIYSSNVLHSSSLLQKVIWRCSTLLLLPVGTICRYNLMKTLLQLNLMKLYALSNL